MVEAGKAYSDRDHLPSLLSQSYTQAIPMLPSWATMQVYDAQTFTPYSIEMTTLIDGPRGVVCQLNVLLDVR